MSENERKQETEGDDVTGTIKVVYTVLCEKDVEEVITIEQLLGDEKVSKAIKNSFAPKLRNLELEALCEAAIRITTAKTEYSFEIEKDDFADALTLAEEDARKNKRIKKGCEQVKLVDLVTDTMVQ